MNRDTQRSDERPLYAGLFLVTLSTLLLEILGSRLLSVVTWYHISFFAVSLAMLGMAAGAVSVFALAARLEGAAAARALARVTLVFAVAIPVCHVLGLAFPATADDMSTLTGAAAALRIVLLMTAPFYLSGVAVTLALTRLGRPIGRLYAADLFGAAAGCLLIIPLLGTTNITAATLFAAVIAGVAAICFYRLAGLPWRGVPTVSTLAFVVAAGLAATGLGGIGTLQGKDMRFTPDEVWDSAWNTYSQIVVLRPKIGPAFYWGPGEGAERFQVTTAGMAVDAGAATVMTEWNGDPADLEWVKRDLTYLPYFVRQGNVAVIGVGGGRDLLSAIAGGSTSVTGIELNSIFIDWLEGPLRDFAGIADRPEVRLVNDEARSYLARSDEHFDILQMSLIDTWAATGAGAFALSENGLYTLEAWQVFLDSLAPRGVFSVSRWFSPSRLSETNRLLALGAATLILRGHTPPARHIVLVARRQIATLLVSNEAFSEDDLRAVDAAAERFGFEVLLAPGRPAPSPALGAIVGATTRAELDLAIGDPVFDFSPPSDERPYFFNILRPRALFGETIEVASLGVIAGNVRATHTLVVLIGVCLVLVVLIVLGPLLVTGRPAMAGASFLVSALYFAGIGSAYMLCQFGLLQRFVIILGHPTYSLAVVLFTMILCTGLGSYLSDRIDLAKRAWLVMIPLGAASCIALLVLVLPQILETAATYGLVRRCLVAVLLTAPLAVILGFCFPLGLRLVEAMSPDAAPWMWGVNGAFSVLGSVAALALSMWSGIDTTMTIAALLYASLSIALPWMGNRAAAA